MPHSYKHFNVPLLFKYDTKPTLKAFSRFVEGRFTSRTGYLFVQNSLFETSAVQTQNTIIVRRRGKEHKTLKRKPDRRVEKEKDSSRVLFLTTRVCCVPLRGLLPCTTGFTAVGPRRNVHWFKIPPPLLNQTRTLWVVATQRNFCFIDNKSIVAALFNIQFPVAAMWSYFVGWKCVCKSMGSCSVRTEVTKVGKNSSDFMCELL